MAEREKLMLLDGHSILNRAFYGMPLLNASSGLHTNAVYGFLMILFSIMETEKPTYLVGTFDTSAPTFRHKMFDAYKGTRKKMPDELAEQVPVIKEVLKSMGVRCIEQPGLEADDLIGALSIQGEQNGMDVTIVSGDRDLLQLATERVKILLARPKRSGTEQEGYFAADVQEKYGVTPKEFIDVKALMGDTSDNIPGLPGVGEKTATKLIMQYHSIEEANAHLEEIKPNKAREAFREHFDLAQMSKDLATIKTDCLEPFAFEEARIGNFYTPEAYDWFKKLEFRNLLSRFEEQPETAQKEMPLHVLQTAEEADALCARLAGKEIGAAIYQPKLRESVTVLCIADGEKIYIADKAILDKRLSLVPASCSIFSAKDLKRALLMEDAIAELSGLGNSLFDVHLAAYLLDPLKNQYAYDLLSTEYLGKTVPGANELLGKTKWEKAYEKEKETLYRILAQEAETMRCLQPVLTEKVKETGMWKLYETIELPLSDTLLRMERYGICAKAESLHAYSEMLGGRITELESQIYEAAGETFNINSPKQLGDILFGKMQLKGGKKTKTGYSTAADVLEKLAPEYPIIEKILEYRQLAKLKSTYADGLTAFIEQDGRIRSLFHQTITATGRISSAEPNLQNIPIRMELGRQIRKVFVPEDGYVFVDADYSQIELRVLAHLSGDEQLIEAYRQNEDIHALTASQVFHVPIGEVTSLQRRSAKAVNFGIIYGISSFGLGQDLGISRKEAEAYMAGYFETYPKIKAFLDGLVASAKETGYSYTLYDRRRPVPELFSSNFMQRAFGERIAMNSPIQGTAADIIKIAMLRVEARLQKEQMKSRLILQVHDELLIEAWKPEQEKVVQILKEEMEQAADLKVPLIVDVNSGENWYETK